jgi:hypothetical protein
MRSGLHLLRLDGVEGKEEGGGNEGIWGGFTF